MTAQDPEFRRDALLVPGRSAAALAAAAAEPTALRRLLADAEAALAARPPSVLDKRHVPPSGDKRDFFSLSIYFWPDPARPDGRPWIPRDGQPNPALREYDRPAFVTMADLVDTLALAWHLTRDERYAAGAAACLRTWFLDPVSGMRPHMLFAQFIPGDDVVLPWKDYPARFVPGSGGRPGVYVSFGGVIEDLHLVPITDGVRLLRGSRAWSDADDAGLRAWYAAYADWLLTHQHGLDEASCRNNHASWYWAGIATFLEFAGRGDEARRRVAAALPARYADQLAADGSQPEELVRCGAKGYTAFSLIAWADLAVSCARAGYDAWAVDAGAARSLRGAIDWFLPYLLEERPWAWRQTSPFDAHGCAGFLAAAAVRFPDGPYAAALAALRARMPADHRFRLLF